MINQPGALRPNHKATTVVDHETVNSAVDHLQHELNARRRRVLLDVAQSFGHLPVNHGFELICQLVCDLELHLCFDPGQ